MESVTFKLPKDLVATLEALARDEDVSPGQILRLALERELRRREVARTPARVEERLLAPIRRRASPDFTLARDWRGLKQALLDRGYILRESGGGLALHDAITGRFLCRTSEIGFGYPTLMRQLGGPFPGHSQNALIEKLRDIPLAGTR